MVGQYLLRGSHLLQQRHRIQGVESLSKARFDRFGHVGHPEQPIARGHRRVVGLTRPGAVTGLGF